MNRYHRFRHLDREVLRLGFGCWQLGGESYVNGRPNGWGHTDEQEALRAIHAALDADISFFDTAVAYGDGRSEELLGKALKAASDGASAVICTKFGPVINDAEKTAMDFSSENLLRSFDASLKRLGRDHIDILLLHNPPDDFDWRNYDSSPFEQLVRAGKLRAYGASCRSIRGVHNLLESNFGTVVEWVFNLFERRPLNEIFPKLESAGYDFIARSPFASGFLTSQSLGSFKEFSATDYRSTLPTEFVEWYRQSLNRLRELDDRPGGLTTTALRFCLSFNEVAVAIPGLRKTSHVYNCLESLDAGPLDESTIKLVNREIEIAFPGWC